MGSKRFVGLQKKLGPDVARLLWVLSLGVEMWGNCESNNISVQSIETYLGLIGTVRDKKFNSLVKSMRAKGVRPPPDLEFQRIRSVVQIHVIRYLD